MKRDGRKTLWVLRHSQPGPVSLLGAFVCLLLAFTVSAQPAREITSAEAVRRLSGSEAEARLPVRLRGVVTFFDETLFSRFIQDETAGIYLRDSTNTPALRPGQWVEVVGAASSGEYAPIVEPERVQVLGEAQLPSARAVTFDELASGKEDSQFVEVVGIVRSVVFDQASQHYAIALATGGGRLTVYARNLPVAGMGELVDATIRVRGVCATQFNQQRQLFALRLMVPRPEDLIIEKPSAADPFAVPARSLGSLLQFSPQGTFGHRVRVVGTVIFQQPGVALFIQDESFALKIQTQQQTPVEIGDRVEVLGFTAQGSYTPILEDALYRKVGTGTPPTPAAVDVDAVLTGKYDFRLVRLTAKLLDLARQSREQFLVLESDRFIFHAHLEPPPGTDVFAGLEKGSELAVTGICLIEPGEWQAGRQWRARSFQLLLRSPADVVVRAAPPWWTLRRLLWMFGLLLVVVLGAFAWVGVLRRRVHQQTGIIRQQLQVEAGLKERYVDLFENANDMVFTHDLNGGITSINRSGERLVQRGRERLLHLKLLDLVADDQRVAAQHWLDQVRKGQELPPAEWDFLNAAGHRVKLEISSRLIEQEGKPFEVEGIARDITERRRLERELLEISNREQRRIGHDLHDGVCQQLAAIAYLVDILGNQLQEQGAPEAAEAEKIGTLINEATLHARSVARGLFPVRLEENGLISALEELASSASNRFHTQCHFACPAPSPAVDDEVALHLYYIAQEALLNAVKHGQATRIEMSLQSEGERGRLRVQDNGIGFQMARPGRSGMGIRIMRYRAKVIGATLDVKTQPGGGTEVVCLFFPARRDNESIRGES